MRCFAVSCSLVYLQLYPSSAMIQNKHEARHNPFRYEDVPFNILQSLTVNRHI
jgi:hypothetical protein